MNELFLNNSALPPPLAAFQTRMDKGIRCDICPQLCKLDEGEVGICGGRKVVNGQFLALNYGQVCSLHLDPIEKKPLYHFYPGAEILSVGPNGCNLSCHWCQNWKISQDKAPTRSIRPQDLVDMVDAVDGIGIAWTYAEPLIWFEFVSDAGRVLKDRGLVNVFITNGYVNPEPLRRLLPLADAFNVDLKAADDRCYKEFCGGRLKDVQRTIRMIYEAGKHLEITHLLVTNVTASLQQLELLVDWIAALDVNIPLHLSRYFPSHRFNEPPTAVEFMLQAYEAARTKLTWVYLGNLWVGKGQSSYCPNCSELLVERTGLAVELGALKGDKCGNCGTKLNFLSGGWN